MSVKIRLADDAKFNSKENSVKVETEWGPQKNENSWVAVCKNSFSKSKAAKYDFSFNGTCQNPLLKNTAMQFSRLFGWVRAYAKNQ